MATLNPDAAPGGRLHLLSLPAELQTMFFDFAYQRHPDTTLISVTDRRRERSSRRQRAGDSDFYPDTTRRFESKVSDFLISKQYFILAARSWVASSEVDINPYSRPNFQGMFDGTLAAFARDVVGDYVKCSFWKLASVRNLRLTIQFLAFEVDGEDEVELPVLNRRLTEQECSGSSVAGMFDHVRGAKRFELMADELQGYFTEAQKGNWNANVKVLEKVVRAKVTAAELRVELPAIPKELREPEWTPLYPDSNVFWESASERNGAASNVNASILEFIIYALADLAGTERSHVEKVVGDLLKKPLPETQACDSGATQTVFRKSTPVAIPTCDEPGIQALSVSLTKGDKEPGLHGSAADAPDYDSIQVSLAALDEKLAQDRREIAELKRKMTEDFQAMAQALEIKAALVESFTTSNIEEKPETPMQLERVPPSTEKKIRIATWIPTRKALVVGVEIVLLLGWCLQWYRYRRMVEHCWQYEFRAV